MFKFLNKNIIEAEWHKVSDLKVGMQIAVPKRSTADVERGIEQQIHLPILPNDQAIADSLDSNLAWDEIESIEYVGTEQVWDIEVEGTHNFIGNNIFAHNTYLQGNLGVGVNPATALLHLAAGSDVANGAPLKFTAGALTTGANISAGAVEWDGTNLFITQTTGPTRKTIAYTSDVSGLSTVYAPINANFVTVTANATLTGETGIDALTTAVSTSSNISTTGTGTITSAGLLTASNGLTLTTGALNLTATSGAIALSGLSNSSINLGTNTLTITSGTGASTFNTTATGINATQIGATTAASGAFTTLTASGNVTLSGANITGASPLSFDGATADGFKTIFAITDPTVASKTITFPNATGTVALTSDIPAVTNFATKALDNLASVAMNANLQWNNTAARTLDIAPTANTVAGNALTISAGSTVTGGTADMAGGNLTLNSGLGKGTGASSIFFQTGRTLTTGSTLQTLTTAMTILGSGNVGIGTTDPFTPLTVNDSISMITGTAMTSYLKFADATSGAGSYVGSISYSHNTNKMSFVTNGNQNVVIDSAGKVGIGNTSPGELLTLGTAGTTAGVLSLAGLTSGTTTIAVPAAAGTYTLTLPASGGTNGYVLSTNGSGTTSWIAASSGSSSLSGLTVATATNTINNGTYAQEWQWNTLAGNSALKLSSTSTAAASNAQAMLDIALSGANVTSTQSTYGMKVSNTHTGTSSTNVGIYTTASGGTNNLALNVDAGQTLLGGTTLTTEPGYAQTLAKLNIVSTMTSTESRSAIAGIHGYYTFTNGGNANYVQVGNRFIMNNNPTTNPNTVVGEMIRVVDSDIGGLSNLVRGMDITANAGGNTAGTNTGLRASGATFGVQGITSALAAGQAIPAALYGESTATTTGDVLRLYSNTMTSATSFATFYHASSAYTGTGLLMDFAVGGGTGSFTGNFIELQNNNATVFKVDSNGVTSTGLGATASTGAVCSSLTPGNAPAAGVAYELQDCSGTPTADYAEMYPVEEGILYGDIVAMGTEIIETYDVGENGAIDWTKVKGNISKLVKSRDAYQQNVIGIASDNHGDFSSTGYNIKETDNPMPVALSGRVPVKISASSSPIKMGDYITTSSIDEGQGMRALKSGFVIGKALEDWSPESGAKGVMVFVEQGYYESDSAHEFVGEVKFGGLTYFNASVEFAKSVKFADQVEFEVPPLFNNDTAGFAVIKAGAQKVDVTFDKAYIAQPVVSATIALEDEENTNMTDEEALAIFNEGVTTMVTNKTKDKFTIRINKVATKDIRFSWIALAVKNPKIFESVMPGLVIEESTLPSAPATVLVDVPVEDLTASAATPSLPVNNSGMETPSVPLSGETLDPVVDTSAPAETVVSEPAAPQIVEPAAGETVATN